MTRKEILETAAKCVCGDREQDYGSPENNFQTIANFWNAYLNTDAIRAWDVAAMLALLKVARISSGHAKGDNWVDLAGYAACGGEIQSAHTTAAAPPDEITSYASPTIEKLHLHYGAGADPDHVPSCIEEQLEHALSGDTKIQRADEEKLSPCIVWVFDDGSWTYDLLPSFGMPVRHRGKTVAATHTDCTVVKLRFEDGTESKGWYRNECPPVDLSHVEVRDEDCD